MKHSTLLPIIISLFAQFEPTLQFIGSPPDLQYDPNTASDCVDWYDNLTPSESWIEGTGSGGNAPRGSCAAVRDYFTITPQQFSTWNPSLSLDCEPWRDWTSYCIVTISRLNETNPLFLEPGFQSCFVEGSLQEKVTDSKGGDPDLTIEKCVKRCKRAFYPFAGMQNGNECWCGEYAGRNKTAAQETGYRMDTDSWARNQSECNVPCTGDESKFCGGKDLLAVFDTEDHEPYGFLSTMGVSTGASSTRTAVGTMTSTGTVTSIATATSTTGDDAPGASETRASSGATRNMAVSWGFVLVLSVGLFS